MDNTFIEWAAVTSGLLLVLQTFVSLIKTLIVPRGLSSNMTALVEGAISKLFRFVSRRFDDYRVKDRVLVMEAPIAILGLLIAWFATFLLGYALMLWPLIDQGFGQALRESGSSMLTLGYAGTAGTGPTLIQFFAALTGLIVIALQIAYLPTLYAAFNRREALVTTLQSRAGSPAWGPEILARHRLVSIEEDLASLYIEWERWSADLAESHTNYPVLIYFRSPHPLRSWVVGLLAVLDAAALQLSLCPSSAPTQARLCIRMGFTALRDIATATRVSFDPDPFPEDPIELTFEDFQGAMRRLEEVGFPMERTPEEAWPHFRGWRVNYESVAYALADRIMAPPGPWSGPRKHLPDVVIVPQRPADRRPEDSMHQSRPKGGGTGW